MHPSAQFWDTAPTYSGRPEVWDCLKAACEMEDDASARAIVDAMGLRLPDGTPALPYSGAHDALRLQSVV